MSPEQAMLAYSPRALPSGWSALTGGRIVRREGPVKFPLDGLREDLWPSSPGPVFVLPYAGFGLRVTADLRRVSDALGGGWIYGASIRRRDGGVVRAEDAKPAVFGLYRNSYWKDELREIWYGLVGSTTRQWNQDLSFATERIPLDLSSLPGVR